MWVEVSRKGLPLAARGLKCRGDFRATAAAVVAFSELLLGGKASNCRGCFHPDELFSIDELEPTLNERGIAIGPVNP
jgi:hypothetical protein